jgi:integrase
MPKYAHDITDLLSEAEVRKLFDACTDQRIRALLSLFWITGARPAEILELSTDNIKIEEGTVCFTLPTKKLQADGTKFVMKTRQLRVVRPHGLEMDIYLETVVQYIERLRPGELLFAYTRSWVTKSINKLGLDVIGKQITPYHFRHSAVTREATKGRTIDQLKHYKGAKSIKSVEPYLHATPYDITVSSELIPVKKKDPAV